MTSEVEILLVLEEVAHEFLELDEETSLALDQRLVEDFALDSLKQLTLIVETENRFRVRLDLDPETQIETVGDLVRAIETGLRA
jgi:acyl carrier protein